MPPSQTDCLLICRFYFYIKLAFLACIQELRDEKDEVEADINRLAYAAAKDLGLVLDKTIKLEWHKAANSRTRCLRITQKEEKAVRSKLHGR